MTLDTATAKTTLSEAVGPKFSIITKELSGGPDENGRRRFRATASSTIIDRDGDEITLTALQKAAQKFRQGVTIFMDHERKSDNAFGLTDTAEIIQRGADERGTPIWDLDIGGVVNTPSPKAVQLADSIDGGFVKMGASITAQILGRPMRSKGGGVKVDDMDIIEASIVGVASNPRSWAHKAALAVKSYHPAEDEETDEEMTVTKELTVGEDGPEAVLSVNTAVVEETVGPESEVAKAADTDDTISKAGDTCPDCGKGRDAKGCDNGYHTAEKSVDESTLGVQESPAETPETTPDAETDADPAVTQKAFEFEATDVITLAQRARDLAQMVVDRDAQIETLTKERDLLKSESDAAKRVIEKMLAMPLRPKAVATVSDFSKSLPDFLAPEVRDYLSKSVGGNE